MTADEPDIVALARATRRPCPVRSEVLRLMRLLGDTPDAMAASLARLGVTGVPNSPCRCVLAEYLTLFCGLEGVLVDDGRIVAGGVEVLDPGPAIWPAPGGGLRGPWAALTGGFDAGRWPGLVRAEGGAG